MPEEKKVKGYLIYSKTLRDLKQVSDNAIDKYSGEVIYSHEIKHENLSEHQKELQKSNNWYRSQSQDMRVRDEQLYSVAKKILLDKVLNRCTGNIEQETKDAILDTELKVIGVISTYNYYDKLSMDVYLDNVSDYGDEVAYEIVDDDEKFKEEIKNIKYKTSFRSNDDDYVLLEKIEVILRPYSFDELEKRIDRNIKRVIREELTYCLKSGKIIIPQEYLDKGQDGIKEWRGIKKAGNKNNSIEKRMLKEIVHEKKRFAYMAMLKVMYSAVSNNWSYKLPCLEIDGRYNKQRTLKLITHILGKQKDQYYIDIKEEDIVNKFKEYWKGVLAESNKEIDNIKVEDVDKQ